MTDVDAARYVIQEIAIVFAVWRLSSLFANEDGPFDVFKIIRRKLKKPFNCFWCISVWIAFLFSVNFQSNFILYTLAYSGIAIFIEVIITRVDR